MVESTYLYRVTLVTPNGELSVRVREDEHIWDAAAAAGIKLPAICHQGRCLTCAGRLDGPGEVDQSD
ncbi:MAG: 2Fe-2S iron-sulfur cluster-binding protein, partial [Terriglobales bacterium]